MRTVVLYELLSLDGVAEDPDAFIHVWDEVMDENLGAVISTQDAVILGRRTYEEWARFWPDSDIEPFSSFINPVAKYVATSQPLEPPWRNATPIEGDLATFVRNLRDEAGGEIGIHASLEVAQSLLAAGLVDVVALVVAPVVSGAGRRLFAEGTTVPLHLESSVATPSGHLLLRYRVERTEPAGATA